MQSIAATTALILLVLSTPGAAQQLWVIDNGGTSITGEFIYTSAHIDHPDDKVGRGYEKSLYGVILGASIDVGKGFRINTELPVSLRYDTDPAADRYYWSVSHSSPPPEYGIEGESHGNPYIGAAYAWPASDFSVEAGLRLPLYERNEAPFDRFSLEIARFADIARPGAYATRGLPASVSLSWQPAYGDGPHRFQARGTLGTAERGYSHLFVGSDFRFHIMRLLVGYSLVAEHPRLDTAERVMSELGASLAVPVGPLLPGVAVRIPLDRELSARIDAGYTFYVRFTLP